MNHATALLLKVNLGTDTYEVECHVTILILQDTSVLSQIIYLMR